MIRVALAALLAALPYASASAQKPAPVWQVTDAARAQAEGDYARLKEECSDLFTRYTDDIESIEIRAPAKYISADSPATVVAVKVMDDAELIPPLSRAWGHTLRYYVRGDGISVQKEQSWRVCGWPEVAPPGEDAFYPLGTP